ncbi:N-acetyltransferase [Kitasatospora sp. NPDC088351]|uniref:acyltransferase n=1 Tax=unclassified Kitasatospora TaxID=2633591 RepID=UPI00343CF9AC
MGTVEGGSVVGARVEPGADVDGRAVLGAGTTVWHLAQVREDAVIGADRVIGRGAHVGPGVRIGDRVELQNHALVHEPAMAEDGVFIGPAAVLTNDLHPRSVVEDGRLKRGDDWHAQGVTLREGCSAGGRAVLVTGVTAGRRALVAAGGVVHRDVPDFALVAGVPARRIKWVGRAGEPLEPDGPGRWRCPRTGEECRETGGLLAEARAAYLAQASVSSAWTR